MRAPGSRGGCGAFLMVATTPATFSRTLQGRRESGEQSGTQGVFSGMFRACSAGLLATSANV